MHTKTHTSPCISTSFPSISRSRLGSVGSPMSEPPCALLFAGNTLKLGRASSFGLKKGGGTGQMRRSSSAQLCMQTVCIYVLSGDRPISSEVCAKSIPNRQTASKEAPLCVSSLNVLEVKQIQLKAGVTSNGFAAKSVKSRPWPWPRSTTPGAWRDGWGQIRQAGT